MDDLNDYDYIIVAFSGGKDSTACFLDLLDRGVNKEKIELWHHLIDGAPGSEPFMDWPVTEEYCRQFAAGFEVPIYFSWRDGGFKKEMLRDGEPTGKVFWENQDGSVSSSGGKGPDGTRRKFPQVSADLRVRWCSAYLKIDVMSAAINNQERFKGKKTLVVTGERAEESTSRSKYKTFDNHRCHGKLRTVHHWRPIHDWKEKQVWDIIEKYDVWVHPAYWLGWGRLSCVACIFGNEDQWASAAHLYPEMVEKIAAYEEEFGTTIKRNITVKQLVEVGSVYPIARNIIGEWVLPGMRHGIKMHKSPLLKEQRQRRSYLPPGAFGDSTGPN